MSTLLQIYPIVLTHSSDIQNHHKWLSALIPTHLNHNWLHLMSGGDWYQRFYRWWCTTIGVGLVGEKVLHLPYNQEC